MRAIAIEEEVGAERFGAILAFMAKLNIIETAERWKLIRELRNAVNHDYEEDVERLSRFFLGTLEATPELFECYQRLLDFCEKSYGLKPNAH